MKRAGAPFCLKNHKNKKIYVKIHQKFFTNLSFWYIIIIKLTGYVNDLYIPFLFVKSNVNF